MWEEFYLSADSGNLRLVHARLRHNISKGTASEILHHHEKLVSYEEATNTQTQSKIHEAVD